MRAHPTRRQMVAGLAGLTAGVGLGGFGRPVLARRPDPLDFRVFRDGSEIGYHRLDFRAEGERLTVDIDINLEVGIGPLVLYRYRHRNRESWDGDRLIGFQSETDDDGEKFSVSARRLQEAIRIDREPAEDYVLSDPDVLPTTYWREETVRQARLLGTQEGATKAVNVSQSGTETVEAAGRQVPARRYDMDGDLTLTLWYDETGRWVKLAFPLKGSEFDYVLR